MSQVVTEIYDAFRAAGVDDAMAKAAAGALAGREELASKADIAAVKAELSADIAAVKAEVADLKADLKLLKFAYGPAILGLLIKLTFFP